MREIDRLPPAYAREHNESVPENAHESCNEIYIALGSNLGDRSATLTAALYDLNRTPGIRVVSRSSFHETTPVGGPPGQANYLNAAAQLETSLSPSELLAVLQSLELHYGRVREVLCGPRTLDLDLLIFGNRVSTDPDLTLPHPRMWSRDFVLAPLSEIADVAELRRRFSYPT